MTREQHDSHVKSSEVCIKIESTSASLPLINLASTQKAGVNKHTTLGHWRWVRDCLQLQTSDFSRKQKLRDMNQNISCLMKHRKISIAYSEWPYKWWVAESYRSLYSNQSSIVIKQNPRRSIVSLDIPIAIKWTVRICFKEVKQLRQGDHNSLTNYIFNKYHW